MTVVSTGVFDRVCTLGYPGNRVTYPGIYPCRWVTYPGNVPGYILSRPLKLFDVSGYILSRLLEIFDDRCDLPPSSLFPPLPSPPLSSRLLRSRLRWLLSQMTSCTSTTVYQTLLSKIDNDQIPKEYGGASEYALGEHPYEASGYWQTKSSPLFGSRSVPDVDRVPSSDAPK